MTAPKDAERLAEIRKHVAQVAAIAGMEAERVQGHVTFLLRQIDGRDSIIARLTRYAAQPSADDVERAREIVEAFPSYAFNRQHIEVLAKEVAVALTTARREGAELRALDEAVIQAARTVRDKFAKDEADGYRSRDRQFAIAVLGKPLDALAARDAALSLRPESAGSDADTKKPARDCLPAGE